jgi:hypothetical protein
MSVLGLFYCYFIEHLHKYFYPSATYIYFTGTSFTLLQRSKFKGNKSIHLSQTPYLISCLTQA